MSKLRMVLAALIILILASPALAWLSGYSYRAKLQIDTSTAPTNYQLKIKIIKGNGTNDTTNGGARICLNNHASAWPNDIRLTKKDDTQIDYYVEYWTTSGDGGWSAADSCVVWVEIPAFDTAYYLYYGNSSATDGSNGSNTFLFFENFDNLNNWTLRNGTAGIGVANACTLSSDGSNNSWTNGLEQTGNIVNDTLRTVSVDLQIANSSGNHYIGYSSQWSAVSDLHHTEIRKGAAADTGIENRARVTGAWNTSHLANKTVALQTWYNLKTRISNGSVQRWLNDKSLGNFTDSPDWDKNWTKLNLNSYGSTVYFRKIWIGRFRDPEPFWKTPGTEESSAPSTVKKRIPDWITQDDQEN